MSSETITADGVTINGKEIAVTRVILRHDELRFYPDNPRVYSLLGADEDEPTQDEIEKRLTQMPHVKQLMRSIMANGGLIDPLLVRGSDKVVLEGNSRLAAYRLLSRSNPIAWGEVKCLLLAEDISDDLVFALLGEYHIIGRKDWVPFEQAGYLWRRSTKHHIPPEQMEKELGLSGNTIRHMIEVYSFMVEHQEVDPQRWSYYDEYLKSRKIAKARALLPELDKVLVSQIRTGTIAKAADVRDKLSRVCSADKGRTVRRFVSQTHTLDKCYEDAIAGGADNAFYQRLRKFKEQITNPEVKKEILDMPTEIRNKCKFELGKIYKRAKELFDLLSGDK
jgi:hypothetical protein